MYSLFIFNVCVQEKKKLEIMPETIGNVYLNIPLKTYQCKYELSLIKTFLAINSIFEEKPRAALQLPGRPAETRILAQSR